MADDQKREGAAAADDLPPPPFFASEIWEAVGRFLAAFDEFTYRGTRPGRLLCQPFFQTLIEGPGPRPLKRWLLDAPPGRLYLALRSRACLARLRGWGRKGVILQWFGTYERLTAPLLPLLRSPREFLAPLGSPHRDVLALSWLVPGRWRSGVDGPIDDLYRRALAEHPDVSARLPADSDWFRNLIRVAMDTVDSALMFWEASGSPGGLVFAHTGMQDLALAVTGRRLGRKVVCLQHGYMFDTVVPEPDFTDCYCVWDDWARHSLEARSNGRVPSAVIGPYGIQQHLEARPGPAVDRKGGPPRILLLTSGEAHKLFAVYAPLYRALSSAGVPWELLWKPHQMSHDRSESFGPRCRKITEGSTYELMRECDLILSPLSSTLAEGRMMGLRVACLAHPRESWMRRWSEAFDVPLVLPAEDVVGAVKAILERPPPPPMPSAWRPDSLHRLAAIVDAALRGDPVPAGPWEA